LLGLGLGLVYPLYQFSKPVETRLETEILFVGSAGATGATGVTGVKEIDAALSTFDPQINLQDIIQQWPVWPLLGKALDQSGLKRIDSGTKAGCPGDLGTSEKVSKQFLVQDGSAGQTNLLIDLQSPRSKPVKMIIQGSFPQEKLKTIGANLLRVLNDTWSQQALELARTQRPYAEKVRAQLIQEPAGSLENLPRLAQPIQITADFSLLSNYQRIRLIDQFVDKLKDWPQGMVFAYPGKQNFTKLLPSRTLWFLPFVVGAGFFLAILFFLNFLGPLAAKVLGEKDLAEIHPSASIYPTKMVSGDLGDLLAASFARAGQEKPKRLAAFIPQAEPDLIEKIRSAAESSGHTFSRNESDNTEACLFPADDPSSLFARLPSKGFGRILLTSKKGEALKSRHNLYQAEADLAGVPITDVILIEG